MKTSTVPRSSDYMHMSRINGEWKIVNVLWDMSAQAAAE